MLNLVLPSKMGDIAKAWFMRDRGHLGGSLALSLVVFEKTCDMLSLLLWCVFGLAILYPQKDGVFWIMTAGASARCSPVGSLLLGSKRFARLFLRTSARVRAAKDGGEARKTRRVVERDARLLLGEQSAARRRSTTTSVFIWFLHLLQIWMFILALRASVPFVAQSRAFAARDSRRPAAG